MDSDRSIPEPGVSADVDPAVRLPAHASTGERTTLAPRWLWLWALGAGLIAGLVSWLGGESTYGTFQPVITRPPNWGEMGPYERASYSTDQQRIKKPISEGKNTALAFGLLGATLGTTLGMAGGLARRSARAGLIAALVGALAGASGGAVMAVLMTPIFYRLLDPVSSPMLAPLLTHLGIWAAVGAAGGLGLGLGLGGRETLAKAVLGGFAGALLGTLLIEMTFALVFPSMRVYEPIPDERTPRLIVHFGVAVIAALGAAMAVRERGKSRMTAPLPS